MIRRHVVLIVLFALGCSAQTPLEYKLSELQRKAKATGNSGTDEQIRDLANTLLDILNDLVWDKEFRSVRSRLPKNHTLVALGKAGLLEEAEDGVSSPYADGNQVVVPLNYVPYLFGIAQVLEHDLAAGHTPIRLRGNPLLVHPMEVGPVMPLLSPQYASRGELASALACIPNDAKCQNLTGEADLAVFLFVFAHELTHIRDGHRAEGTAQQLLGNELEADANAFAISKKFGAALPKDARLFFTAAPAIWLTFEIDRTQGGSAADLATRRTAILRLMNEEDQTRVKKITEPETSRANVGRLRILWKERPDSLFLNGLNVDPGDVEGKELIVASGHYRALAQKNSGIAYSDIWVLGDSGEIKLEYSYLGSPDTARLTELASKKQWIEILLRTSGPNLLPKAADLAYAQAEALHMLGLDRLIKMPSGDVLRTDQRRAIEHWTLMETPLRSWR